MLILNFLEWNNWFTSQDKQEIQYIVLLAEYIYMVLKNELHNLLIFPNHDQLYGSNQLYDTN